MKNYAFPPTVAIVRAVAQPRKLNALSFRTMYVTIMIISPKHAATCILYNVVEFY